eukprot:6189372-Pyramimonas_sp.AAC.1
MCKRFPRKRTCSKDATHADLESARLFTFCLFWSSRPQTWALAAREEQLRVVEAICDERTVEVLCVEVCAKRRGTEPRWSAPNQNQMDRYIPSETKKNLKRGGIARSPLRHGVSSMGRGDPFFDSYDDFKRISEKVESEQAEFVACWPPPAPTVPSAWRTSRNH